jgi:hypothetical protein
VFGSSAVPQAVPGPGVMVVACIACYPRGARRRQR